MILSLNFFLMLSAFFLTFYFEKKIKIKKKESVVSFLICFVMILFLVSGNYQNADSHIYLYRYEQSQDWNNVIKNGQIGPMLLGYVCHQLKLSFQYYRLIYYAIGLVIILFVAVQYVKKSSNILLLYCLFPMIIDATQMKNFMAMAFLTLAIHFLSKTGLKNKLFFLASLVIGSLFHVIILAYIPMLIFCNPKYKKVTRILALTPVVLFSFIFMFGSQNNYLMQFVISNMGSELEKRAGKFLLGEGMNLGFLVYYLMTFLIIFIFYQVREEMKKHPFAYTLGQTDLINTLFLCGIYSVVFMPLYIHAQDFSRLLRNYAPMIHIIILITINARKNYSSSSRKDKFKLSINALLLYASYIFYIVYAFYFDILIYKDSVFIPFFTYNWYF